MNYKNFLGKALDTSKAWQMATYVLAAAVLFLGYQNVQIRDAQTVALAPYGLMSANSQVEIGETAEDNKDYLHILFRGDLQLLLQWQPETIHSNYKTFYTRLSPDAYRRFQPSMSADADKRSDSNMSQTFQPTEITYESKQDDNVFKVRARGMLKRYRGEDLALETQGYYTITYEQFSSGLFAIRDIDVSLNQEQGE